MYDGMAFMKRSASIPLILLLLLACQSGIIQKNDAKKLNQEFEKNVYTAIVDIRPETTPDGDSQKDIVFKKADRLKIYLENGEDWIKVKAFKASDKREQAIPRVILFLLRDDFKTDADVAADIRSRLGKLVTAK